MIDPIGFKPGTVSGQSKVNVEKVDAAQAARRPADSRTAPQVESDVRALAAQMAEAPPVDRERVQQIKRAIEQGQFPIVPARIADRLIAASFNWVSQK
ncbi:flagellar biosynthesis anti-sigma factor FlgM [Sphingomonas flavalba]|uniref:flagellar biosynthesis anti-sigma factor FlgM n=1 Tax=Sphingomonas flavalba TaxID=2559804 RepID=UPI0039E1A60C